jgi:hypothetical protein
MIACLLKIEKPKMDPDSKLQFAIKFDNKMMSCKVILENGNYFIQLNDVDVATIRLNENDRWVQSKGGRLPYEFIEEIGSHIEARYREKLFAEN